MQEIKEQSQVASNHFDKVLAGLYLQALQDGMRAGAVPEFIENIPADSTFGKWWKHLHDTVTSKVFISWAESKKVDRTKTLTATPLFDYLNCTVAGESKTFWGGDEDDSWKAATDPLMRAAEVIRPGGGEIELPTSFTVAPFAVVGDFYGEPKLPWSTDFAIARVAELERKGEFNPIPSDDKKRALENRSDDSLNVARTALGDVQDEHALIKKVHQFFGGAQALDRFLTETDLAVHIDGTYARLNEGARTASIEAFIKARGWNIPDSREVFANLIRVLAMPSLPKQRLGNFAGALSWPIPLDEDQQKVVHSHVLYNLHLPGMTDKFRDTRVLGYLSHEHYFSPSDKQSPRKAIEAILDSAKAQELGVLLQRKMGVLSSADSYYDWVLAAIATTLDEESMFHPKKDHVAGLNLAAGHFFGKPLGTIKQALIDHLVTRGRASTEMAPMGAHILLSRAAPELLVKDIPETVVFGSVAWASLKSAVARIEVSNPGASAELGFSEIISRDANEPISSEESLFQTLTSQPVLMQWGEINGILPMLTGEEHSPSAIEHVRQKMMEERAQLGAVALALKAKPPTQKNIALKKLEVAFGNNTPFELTCITTRYALSDAHRLTPSLTTIPVGNYSILDLYLSGRAAEKVDWVSTDLAVSINRVLDRLAVLPEPKALHERAFTEFRKGIENAYLISAKHLISQLPLEDRRNIEFGAIKVYVEGQVIRTTVRTPSGTHVSESSSPGQSRDSRSLLIRTERGNQTEFYEISAQHGWIRKREELKAAFKEGVQEQWVISSRDILSTDESNRAIKERVPEKESDRLAQNAVSDNGIYPASFISERSEYLGNLLSSHTTAELDFTQLFESTKELTTFDREEGRKKLGHEIFLGIVPFASATRHLIQGRPLEALGDVLFDGIMYLTTLGFGKGAGALKGLKAVKSFGNAIGKLVSHSLKELGELSANVFKAARRGVNAGITQLRLGIRKLDLLELGKKTDIAKGTVLISADNSYKGAASFDELTGNWYQYDSKVGKSYGLPIDFTPDDISTANLHEKLAVVSNSSFSNSINSICYNNAMLVAMAEKKLSRNTFDTVTRAVQEASPGANNYTPAFKKLMGITDNNSRNTFEVAEVVESGFVNFKYGTREGGHYFHTVYIHKNDAGQLVMYSSNSHTLDFALVDKGAIPQVAGLSNVYPLDETTLGRLQGWLTQNNHEYVFVGASVVDKNARWAMTLG